MKISEIEEVLSKSPKVKIVFKVVRVYPWMKALGIEKGENFYFIFRHWKGDYTFKRILDGLSYSLGASSVKFIGYIVKGFDLVPVKTSV